MAQVTIGIHALLSSPFVYELFQNIMGAKSARERLVKDHIRPTPDMRILDLGCGPAEILRFLPEDIDYVGYDISETYIKNAREKFKGRGAFHCRLLELEEAKSLEKFDLVMAIGVLHHMDDDVAEAFITLAKAALKPGGRLLTHDPVYAKGQNPIAKFLIDNDRGQNVREAAAYEALARKVFSDVSGKVRHQTWIPYTHWTMECSA